MSTEKVDQARPSSTNFEPSTDYQRIITACSRLKERGELLISITEPFRDTKALENDGDGRLFCTKDKSLIFYAYAYDLDQQGAKRAQAFQASGRRGPDFKQALNLGIF